MSRQILAIDIRNAAIAAVLLNTGLKSSVIEGCAYLPLPSAAAPGEALRKTLEELKQRIAVNGARVVVALPGERSLYRSLTLPFKEEKKIRQILPFELEPGIPLPVESLVIDYQKSPPDGPNEVLAVVIEQKVLDAYLEDMALCGLDPQWVVPGSFSMINSLLTLDTRMPRQALVLDMDDSKTSLFTVLDGRIAQVRILPALPVSTDTAAAMEAFVQKIRQTITAFADNAGTDFSPAAVYLCGPALREAATLQWLKRALAMPTRSIDLLAFLPKVEMPAKVTEYNPWLQDNALALALAEAGGRTGPGFHRRSSPLRDFWITYRAYIKTPALIAAAVLLLGLSGVLFDSLVLSSQVKNFDSAIVAVYKETFPEAQRVTGATAAEQLRAQINEIKKGAENGQPGVEARSIDMLLELSRLIPADIEMTLDRLISGDGSMTISGEAPGFNVVDDIKSRLAASSLFRQVTIASANMDKAGNKVRFKIKIDL